MGGLWAIFVALLLLIPEPIIATHSREYIANVLSLANSPHRWLSGSLAILHNGSELYTWGVLSFVYHLVSSS